MMNSNKGFTLLELMVTVAILAILLSIAAPSFRTQIEASRLRADTDNIMAALQLARSEAVTRSLPVTVSNFSAGATVMQGATSLRVFPAQSSGVAIAGAAITFRPDGSVLVVPPARVAATVTGPSEARNVCVNYIGQASIVDGATLCP
ncbi:MAG: GspH/FimT family pseudopilin [Pseudomonadaceae bacterium]|nr:GspH/FimT family pseudopilin [Pseudomonadaceae bacterium]